ncbi:MAG: NAD-dependent epimerase/dehydratase family protein, partial [Anaerolineae bacterium]|nr:NAD-dependent epimerase/dehydratase family protein [Anaerolineae bacterium]
GQSQRPIPPGAEVIHADIRDPGSVVEALGSTTFDVVVDWIAYTPEHVETDLSLFSGRVGQYIFISTASAYLKPAALPILESAPLGNPHWAYSRAKIACEERLMRAFRDEGFPVTLVRPSHTYDATKLPMYGRYTVIDRMRRGQPVIVHGDGTSLWVLTHHEDFARGFVGLLGNHRTLGETFHITSDEVLTWNEIFLWLGRAAGVEPQLVHVASETLAAFDAEWGTSLLGDKSHSVIFDNSKLRRYVPDYAATIPFAQGAREVIAWHDAAPERRVVDPAMNALFDRILATVGQIHP